MSESSYIKFNYTYQQNIYKFLLEACSHVSTYDFNQINENISIFYKFKISPAVEFTINNKYLSIYF